MSAKQTSFGIQHRIHKDDPTALVGKRFAEITRLLAQRITNVWAQNKTDIDVRIVVTLTVEDPE